MKAAFIVAMATLSALREAHFTGEIIHGIVKPSILRIQKLLLEEFE